jgi:hypothetical protein
VSDTSALAGLPKLQIRFSEAEDDRDTTGC